MELLALEGKIKEKIYGKQKIYFADQVCRPQKCFAALTCTSCFLKVFVRRDSFFSWSYSKGPVPGCEGCWSESDGLSDFRDECRGPVHHTGLQAAGFRWATLISVSSPHTQIFAALQGLRCCRKRTSLRQRIAFFVVWLIGNAVSVFTELKELTSSLTTEELVSEIRELRAECAERRARLEAITSATNHVTPEEREKVGHTWPESYTNM